MGCNCLKATEPLRENSLLFTIQRNRLGLIQTMKLDSLRISDSVLSDILFKIEFLECIGYITRYLLKSNRGLGLVLCPLFQTTLYHVRPSCNVRPLYFSNYYSVFKFQFRHMMMLKTSISFSCKYAMANRGMTRR